MNGAELPCGAILQVQPADSSYEQQKTSHYTNQQNLLDKKEGTNIKNKDTPAGNDDKKEDDSTGDLDDFFDSLT